MEAFVITIFRGDQSADFRDLRDRLFKLRYRVFIGQRRWTLPCRLGERDIDQYDVPEAVYFSETNEEGELEAHVRLTPTPTHSLMADYFPHLVMPGMSPRGEGIYEATRYIVLPSRKSRSSNRAAKARILSRMLEWGIETKLRFIQTVIDTATFASFVEMTPETIPLGLSHEFGGGPLVAGGGECMGIRWPVNEKVLADVRAYGGLLDEQTSHAEAA